MPFFIRSRLGDSKASHMVEKRLIYRTDEPRACPLWWELEVAHTGDLTRPAHLQTCISFDQSAVLMFQWWKARIYSHVTLQWSVLLVHEESRPDSFVFFFTVTGFAFLLGPNKLATWNPFYWNHSFLNMFEKAQFECC